MSYSALTLPTIYISIGSNDKWCQKWRQHCFVKIVEVNQTPHLCVFADRDIAIGEELRYDYGVPILPWRKVYSKKRFHLWWIYHDNNHLSHFKLSLNVFWIIFFYKYIQSFFKISLTFIYELFILNKVISLKHLLAVN